MKGNVASSGADDHDLKVREGYSILAQGVELVHFETLNMLIGGKKTKKIVWMVKNNNNKKKNSPKLYVLCTIFFLLIKQDADILRICVDFSRPTLTDKAKGRVPSGS